MKRRGCSRHLGIVGFLFAAAATWCCASARAGAKPPAEAVPWLALPAAMQADSQEQATTTTEEGKPQRTLWPLRPGFGDEGLIDYLDYDIVGQEGLFIDYRSLLYCRRAAGDRGRGMHMIRHDLGLSGYFASGFLVGFAVLIRGCSERTVDVALLDLFEAFGLRALPTASAPVGAGLFVSLPGPLLCQLSLDLGGYFLRPGLALSCLR